MCLIINLHLPLSMCCLLSYSWSMTPLQEWQFYSQTIKPCRASSELRRDCLVQFPHGNHIKSLRIPLKSYCIRPYCRKQASQSLTIIFHMQSNPIQPDNRVGGTKKLLPPPTCELFQNCPILLVHQGKWDESCSSWISGGFYFVAGRFKTGHSDRPQWHRGYRLELLGSTVANDTPKYSF